MKIPRSCSLIILTSYENSERLLYGVNSDKVDAGDALNIVKKELSRTSIARGELN